MESVFFTVLVPTSARIWFRLLRSGLGLVDSSGTLVPFVVANSLLLQHSWARSANHQFVVVFFHVTTYRTRNVDVHLETRTRLTNHWPVSPSWGKRAGNITIAIFDYRPQLDGVTSSIKYDSKALDCNPKKADIYDNLLWIFRRFMTPLVSWVRLVIRSLGSLLCYHESVVNGEDQTQTVIPRTFSSKCRSAFIS